MKNYKLKLLDLFDFGADLRNWAFRTFGNLPGLLSKVINFAQRTKGRLFDSWHMPESKNFWDEYGAINFLATFKFKIQTWSKGIRC